ncbi:MAG: Rv1355c family protein [Flavobacteriales bacterium]|nr:Rv1355c family protein [Flavobacteriales bacterium]HRO39410.1 Rv1355c family protein [Flavobacteriales bacterium]HRP82077.1 Rv1355c family protein [Flavobacteriales bacterium]
MDATIDRVLSSANDLSAEYRPVIFRLPSDQQALKAVIERHPRLKVYDRLDHQLRELIKTQQPNQKFNDAQLEEAIINHLGSKPLKEYGAWIFYPWSETLLHLLDEEEFTLLRTDRNRNKITREEQERLSRIKVGVIGLSVGQSVSVTMALERSFGEIRLADFDTLDLSNLNRIRTGVHNLGLNKAVVTAREIAEIDPFLQVTCYAEGITTGNMDAFFTEGGRLDMLVEECDSVDIKILVRQKAKAMGIPVVMDMSDRGCLDVERFDLEPNRPIMHGWIDHLDLEAAKRPMTSEEKVPYMLPITGMETLSPRMKASVIELGQTVSTWPQLATSVVLGGALAGDAVRRIALDQFRSSGRWFVDLEEQVADPPEATLASAHPATPKNFSLSNADMERLDTLTNNEGTDAIGLDEGTVEQVLEAGSLAPSSGNMQPWKFMRHNNRLLLFHDHGRSHSMWDPDHLAAHLGLGACVENMVLKAHELGKEVRTTYFPDPQLPSLVAVLEFHHAPSTESEPHAVDDLAPMIGIRCTNRKYPAPGAVPDTFRNRLEKVGATVPGCTVTLLEGAGVMGRMADLCGAAERIRVLNPTGHREFFGHEVRWTPEEAVSTRDGLDLATMELRPIDLAGLQVASDRRAVDLVDAWGGGKGFENVSAPVIRASMAAVLFSCAKNSAVNQLLGGRLMERVWMLANAEGLSVHPIAAPIFLTHAMQFNPEGLRAHEREELEQLRKEFMALCGLGERTPLFMVRLSPGGQPTARSLRLPLQKLMVQPAKDALNIQ